MISGYTTTCRLNIYYLLLEKMNSFADETKYDISNVPGAQIAQDYESKRTDAWSIIENLGIIKRIVSVCTFSSTRYPLSLIVYAALQREWCRLLAVKVVRQVWVVSRLSPPHLRALPA